jgi:hypothetical protein
VFLAWNVTTLRLAFADDTFRRGRTFARAIRAASDRRPTPICRPRTRRRSCRALANWPVVGATEVSAKSWSHCWLVAVVWPVRPAGFTGGRTMRQTGCGIRRRGAEPGLVWLSTPQSPNAPGPPQFGNYRPLVPPRRRKGLTPCPGPLCVGGCIAAIAEHTHMCRWVSFRVCVAALSCVAEIACIAVIWTLSGSLYRTHLRSLKIVIRPAPCPTYATKAPQHCPQ